MTTLRRHLNLFVSWDATVVADKFVNEDTVDWFSNAINDSVNNNKSVTVFSLCLDILQDFLKEDSAGANDFFSSFGTVANFINVVQYGRTITPEMHKFMRDHLTKRGSLCIAFEYCGLLCSEQNQHIAQYAKSRGDIISTGFTNEDPSLRDVFEFMTS